MPWVPAAACSIPTCPHRAVWRGRCDIHGQSTSERGYGRQHQRERRAALAGARCELCGCVNDLQRDHRDPTLRGAAREQPANKRWLCDCAAHRCHSRFGVKRGSPVEKSLAQRGGPVTCPPMSRAGQVSRFWSRGRRSNNV
jgi:hypothetical protein